MIFYLWLNCLGFLKTFNFLKNSQSDNDIIFHRIFPHGRIWAFPDIGAGMVPTNSKSMRKSRTWELSVFPYCSIMWEFAHPVVWEMYGLFLLHQKYLGAYNFGIFVFCPYFSHNMWEFTHSMLLELHGFLLQAKYLRNP